MSVIVGIRKRVTATFTVSGTATDPGAVTCLVMSPDGVTTIASTSKTGTGVYYTDVTLDDPGRWTIRFEGTSPVVSAQETTIDVDPSAFYPED